MFDLDFSKLLIVGAVALIVVGPKDLPRLLRTLGQVVGKMRRMRNDIQSQFTDLMREADLEEAKGQIDAIARSTHMDIAVNPKTAMRGQLPSAPDAPEASATTVEGLADAVYASPEMRDYLAPSLGAQAADASPIGEAASKVEAADENAETADGPCKSARSSLAPSAV